MPTCSSCETDYDTLENTCRYCNQSYCPDHYLPEKHDCFELDYTDTDRKHFESLFDYWLPTETGAESGPQPMGTKDVRTFGDSGKERTSCSGPDVASDGSIATDDAEQNTDESASMFTRLKNTVTGLF